MSLPPWPDWTEAQWRKARAVTLSFQLDWDEDQHPRDDSGKFAEGGGAREAVSAQVEHLPASIPESFRKAGEAHAAEKATRTAIVDAFPDGTTVKVQRTDWTKTHIKGEKAGFWTSKKGGKTSEQMSDDIASFVKAGLIPRDVVMEHFPYHEKFLSDYYLDWDEGQHPRDEAGKFAEGAGNGKGGETVRAATAQGHAGAGSAGRESVSTAAAKGRPDANPEAQHVADSYNAAHGLPPVAHEYVTVDEERAGAIADAYDALPDDDRANPEVREAFEALDREIGAQWEHIVASGMQFEPWDKEGQPYRNSTEMAEDVRDNKHMYFYKGGEALDPGLTAMRDKLRVVHDYLGHAAGGYGFGARGEENAWVSHSQMLTPAARRAMTTLTRGQNSWVNFGRQNYNADGTHKNIPPAARPFAKQKIALLPDEFVRLPGETTVLTFDPQGNIIRAGRVRADLANPVGVNQWGGPEDWGKGRPMSRARAQATLHRPASAYVPVHPDAPNTHLRFTQDGHYTPERMVLHDAIATEMMGTATPVEDPVAHVVGGGWGAGKSTLLKSGLLDIPENHVRSDGDANKKLLPEFQEGVGTDPTIAVQVHRESAVIAKDMLYRAADGKFNVVSDGTGNITYDDLAGKVAIMRAGGLKVVADYVTTDTATALARAETRGEETGRYVPRTGLYRAHASVSQILPRAMEEGLFDSATLWDTTGRVPVKVASSVGKTVTVHAPVLWDKFLAKAHEPIPRFMPREKKERKSRDLRDVVADLRGSDAGPATRQSGYPGDGDGAGRHGSRQGRAAGGRVSGLSVRDSSLSYRDKLRFLLGDFEGHPFRGNQWTEGSGQGEGARAISKKENKQAGDYLKDGARATMMAAGKDPTDPFATVKAASLAKAHIMKVIGKDLAEQHSPEVIATALGELLTEKQVGGSPPGVAPADVAALRASGDLRTADDAEAVADELTKTWSVASSDNLPVACALQEIAREAFGMQDARTIPNADHLNRFSASTQAVMRTYLHATYEDTQRELTDAGITHVTLFRGSSRGGEREGWDEVKTNPLTSFSSSPLSATEFAERSFNEPDEPSMTVIRVPKEQVFSTPLTGLGCLRENEYVLLGGTYEVYRESAKHATAGLADSGDAGPADAMLERAVEMATVEKEKETAVKKLAADPKKKKEPFDIDGTDTDADWIKFLSRDVDAEGNVVQPAVLAKDPDAKVEAGETVPVPRPTNAYRDKLAALLLGDVEGHPFRGNQWTEAGEGSTQARAKTGGEYGPNREWYPGGAFIATTEMPKRERQKIARMAGSGTELVDFGQRQKLEPGQIPIYRDVGNTLNRDFTVNETALGHIEDADHKTQLREASTRAQRGERLFDIKEFPALARVSDVARLIVAKQPVPGAALDRAKRWRPDLGDFLKRADTPTHLRDWDEDLHPRDDAGKFTEGEGGGGGDTAAHIPTSEHIRILPRPDVDEKAIHKATVERTGKTPQELIEGVVPALPWDAEGRGKWTAMVGERPADPPPLGDQPYDETVVQATYTIDGTFAVGMSVGFATTETGERVANLHLLDLESTLQGKDVAKTIIGKHMEEYHALGVKEVSLWANIDVGGYAWARYGFTPTEPEEIVRLAPARLKHAHVAKTLPPEVAEEAKQALHDLSVGDPQALWRVADLRHPVKESPTSDHMVPLGRYLLTAAQWDGKLRLDDPVAMRRMNHYLKQRKYKLTAWTEDLHPRDAAGKFTEGEGGEGGAGKKEGKIPTSKHITLKPSGAETTQKVMERTGQTPRELVAGLLPELPWDDKNSQWEVEVEEWPADPPPQGDAPYAETRVYATYTKEGEWQAIKMSVGFAKTETGERIATLHLLDLQGAMQGQDVAKTILAKHFEEYEATGVKEVSLLANMDVGGYAWARYGFTPTEPDEAVRSVTAKLNKPHLKDLPPSARAQATQAIHDLQGGDPQAMWRIADLREPVASEGAKWAKLMGEPPPPPLPLGRYLLLEQRWHGKIRLDDEAAMRRLNHYLEQRKKK